MLFVFYLRVPLQRLFRLPGGEFNGIFLADPSGHYRAVLNLISVDAFVLHEPFYGPGQCFLSGTAQTDPQEINP